jgi:hypothetical protein
MDTDPTAVRAAPTDIGDMGLAGLTAARPGVFQIAP